VTTVKRALSDVLWYLRELTGESAYDKYLERHTASHPDAVPLTRYEFEKRRTDEKAVQPRCC
jgi:uncharacterized short protein YbdD (DUF466 family)